MPLPTPKGTILVQVHSRLAVGISNLYLLLPKATHILCLLPSDLTLPLHGHLCYSPTRLMVDTIACSFAHLPTPVFSAFNGSLPEELKKKMPALVNSICPEGPRAPTGLCAGAPQVLCTRGTPGPVHLWHPRSYALGHLRSCVPVAPQVLCACGTPGPVHPITPGPVRWGTPGPMRPVTPGLVRPESRRLSPRPLCLFWGH